MPAGRSGDALNATSLFVKSFVSSRYRSIGLFALILAVPGFFLPLNDFGGNAQAWQQTMDLGHFVIFALFARLLLAALRSRLKKYARFTTASLCLFLILSIEAIQPLFERDASLGDVFYGVAGTALILILDLIACYMQGIQQRLLSVLLIIFSCTAVAFESAVEWSAVYWRYSHFPVLADFESDAERPLWKVTGQGWAGPIEGDVIIGQRALKIETATGSWSGVNYQVGDMDWSAYSQLRMQIYNPGLPFKLSLRIDDWRLSPQYKERVNHRLLIQPGINKININLVSLFNAVFSADFDATAIRRMHFFVAQDAPSIDFYLDELVLN